MAQPRPPHKIGKIIFAHAGGPQQEDQERRIIDSSFQLVDRAISLGDLGQRRLLLSAPLAGGASPRDGRAAVAITQRRGLVGVRLGGAAGVT